MKHYTVTVSRLIRNEQFVVLDICNNNGGFMTIAEPMQILSDPYELVTTHINGYFWSKEQMNAGEINSYLLFGRVEKMYSMDIYI